MVQTVIVLVVVAVTLFLAARKALRLMKGKEKGCHCSQCPLAKEGCRCDDGQCHC